MVYIILSFYKHIFLFSFFFFLSIYQIKKGFYKGEVKAEYTIQHNYKNDALMARLKSLKYLKQVKIHKFYQWQCFGYLITAVIKVAIEYTHIMMRSMWSQM